MAKSSRSGLGRGLGSLLGGSYEEASPSRSSTQRVLVEDERINKAQKENRFEINEDKYTTEQDNVMVMEESITENGAEVTIKSIARRNTEEVSIDHIHPNPDQPRTNFKQESLEELCASIEKDGLLQPILVRQSGVDSYQIIAGERRWQACKKIGLKKVPIRLKEADDDLALELALIENIQRSDLNPIEEAYGYRKMMERRNLTQSEVAQAVSKGRSTIANALRLLELPEEAQKLLFEEKISAGHARAILSIPTAEGRKKLTEKLTESKLSVREAEAIARLFSVDNKNVATKREPLPKSYRTVAKELKSKLNTNVKVKSVKGKHKIEIEFKDEEDLERLFKELTLNNE